MMKMRDLDYKADLELRTQAAKSNQQSESRSRMMQEVTRMSGMGMGGMGMGGMGMGMGGMGMQGMGMQGGNQFMNPALGFVAQGGEALSTYQGLGGSFNRPAGNPIQNAAGMAWNNQQQMQQQFNDQQMQFGGMGMQGETTRCSNSSTMECSSSSSLVECRTTTSSSSNLVECRTTSSR
jgi:hypothetical protein